MKREGNLIRYWIVNIRKKKKKEKILIIFYSNVYRSPTARYTNIYDTSIRAIIKVQKYVFFNVE